MTAGIRSVAHNSACEAAEGASCVCACRGMMHQSHVLREAARTVVAPGVPGAYAAWLTRLFGSPFRLVSADPAAGERPRRAWASIATAGTGKRASQSEQRLVDVAVRDLLSVVHALAPARKRGWLPLVDDLTTGAASGRLAGQLQQWNGDADRQSGFFWAGVLSAAAAALMASGAVPGQAAIVAFVHAHRPAFESARHPRAAAGRTVRPIRELADPRSVSAAAAEVSRALVRSTLPPLELHMVLAVTASVVSADLWRHPAAVRFALIPAVRALRRFAPTPFSLDAPGVPLEDALRDVLGGDWNRRGAW